MTLFVEHPVVFLGYSLSDRNVCSILTSIVGCLTWDKIEKLRDQLIFIEWDADITPTMGHSAIMSSGIMLPVIQVKVPDFADILTVLSELRRAMPAKLLRRLKKQVYDLVLTDDPHHRLAVTDIDDTTKDQDIDIVFGVGTRARLSDQGYVGLTRDDLLSMTSSGTAQATMPAKSSTTLSRTSCAHRASCRYINTSVRRVTSTAEETSKNLQKFHPKSAEWPVKLGAACPPAPSAPNRRPRS